MFHVIDESIERENGLGFSHMMSKQLTIPRLLVEGAGNCSDLVYASGFFPVDPVVFLDEGKRKTLIVPMLEFGRARQEAKGVHVYLPESIDVPADERRSNAKIALRLLKNRRVKRVQVHPFFPAGIVRELEERGVRVEICSGPLYPERVIKRKNEIEKITASQKAAVAAMREAKKVLREATICRGEVLKWNGSVLTSQRLRDVIDITLLKHGCIARETIVAGGAQAADPHDKGSGPLKAGETIVVDIFPQNKSHNYWGDITRTFCKGKPSKELARMYRTVLQAQKKALAMIKPGVIASDVHAMIQTYFDEQGFPTTVKKGIVRGFFHGTGHGVGLDIHESPSIGLAKTKFKCGHVVTVEPGLYDPDIGGVRVEDTVVVTRGGVKILASFPKMFEV